MGFIDSKMLEEINLLELDPYKNSNLIMGIKGEPIILRRDMPSNYSRLFQTKFFDGIYKSISALYENSSEVFQYKRKRAIERLRKNKLFDDMIIPEMRELYYKTYAEIDISTEIKGKAIASNLVTEEELQKNTRETTPNMVNSLKPNEVFVFGSNAEGIHGKGAALTAKTKFGAIQGQSRGLQGQSYAIVTKKNWRVAKSSTLDEIQTEISNFLDFANKNPNKTFYVTKLGSSLAGYSIKEIKNLFENLKMNIPDNVILPEEYEVRDIDNSEKQYRYITEKIVNNPKSPATTKFRVMLHGQYINKVDIMNLALEEAFYNGLVDEKAVLEYPKMLTPISHFRQELYYFYTGQSEGKKAHSDLNTNYVRKNILNEKQELAESAVTARKFGIPMILERIFMKPYVFLKANMLDNQGITKDNKRVEIYNENTITKFVYSEKEGEQWEVKETHEGTLDPNTNIYKFLMNTETWDSAKNRLNLDNGIMLTNHQNMNVAEKFELLIGLTKSALDRHYITHNGNKIKLTDKIRFTDGTVSEWTYLDLAFTSLMGITTNFNKQT